jgi:aminoglycoside/choline kinase family phosphotransferase
LDRAEQLRQWLNATLGDEYRIAPASDDASFRRYFRIRRADTQASLIAMDAPPDKESCAQFLRVAGLFAEAGVHVPSVHAQDLAQGFLLLSDLGDTTYLDALDERSAATLYGHALDALVRIQLASRAGALPDYDRGLLEKELRLFPEWYVSRQLRRELAPAQAEVLESAFSAILANNLAQARVFVHRDYHSRNLMLCDPCPGILDFQDAVYGPVTYDLVSLLRDAYIAWDEERVVDWAVRYWEKARRAGLPVAADFSNFYRDFDWMGAQRQLKVVGIFARLSHRDGKDGYLKDQPRVLGYLRRTCARYRELAPLARLLDELDAAEKRVGTTF